MFISATQTQLSHHVKLKSSTEKKQYQSWRANLCADFVAASELCFCQLSLYLIFSCGFGQLNSKGLPLKTVFLLLDIRFLHLSLPSTGEWRVAENQWPLWLVPKQMGREERWFPQLKGLRLWSFPQGLGQKLAALFASSSKVGLFYFHVQEGWKVTLCVSWWVHLLGLRSRAC